MFYSVMHNDTSSICFSTHNAYYYYSFKGIWKKNTDYLKNEASMKSEFLGQCRQLGIQGDHIKKELVERLKELPGIYEDVCWIFFHITALQIWSKIITFKWNWFTNKI